MHHTQIGNGSDGGPLNAVPAALAQLLAIGSDGGPLNAVPAALAQLLAIARSFGIELPTAPRGED